MKNAHCTEYKEKTIRGPDGVAELHDQAERYRCRNQSQEVNLVSNRLHDVAAIIPAITVVTSR